MSVGLSQQKYRQLRQWQRRMVSTFVSTWLYLLLVIAVQIVLEPPPAIIRLALVPVLVVVVGGTVLQFSVRCTRCGYWLGRQSSLVVPERCRSCGVALRPPKGAV